MISFIKTIGCLILLLLALCVLFITFVMTVYIIASIIAGLSNKEK